MLLCNEPNNLDIDHYTDHRVMFIITVSDSSLNRTLIPPLVCIRQGLCVFNATFQQDFTYVDSVIGGERN